MFAPLILTVTLAVTGVTHPPVVAHKSDPVMTGVQASAYTGKFYRAKQERWRKCIGQREGRFQYWGTGANGRYESTYQMTDALVRGAAWMMRPELQRMFGKQQGKAISEKLLRTPGHKWHRFYMDMAFYTILNWDHDWSGKRHWAGGRYACNA